MDYSPSFRYSSPGLSSVMSYYEPAVFSIQQQEKLQLFSPCNVYTSPKVIQPAKRRNLRMGRAISTSHGINTHLALTTSRSSGLQPSVPKTNPRLKRTITTRHSMRAKPTACANNTAAAVNQCYDDLIFYPQRMMVNDSAEYPGDPSRGVIFPPSFHPEMLQELKQSAMISSSQKFNSTPKTKHPNKLHSILGKNKKQILGILSDAFSWLPKQAFAMKSTRL